MPNGRLTRRLTPRLAQGFMVLTITFAINGAGCQRFALRYTEVTPESTAKPITKVETAAEPKPPASTSPDDKPATPPPPDHSKPSSEVAPPTVSSSKATEPPAPAQVQAAPEAVAAVIPDLEPAEPTRPTPVASEPSPTPLIDEALRRAGTDPEVIVDGPETPKVEPVKEAPKPPEVPLEVTPKSEASEPAPAATKEPATKPEADDPPKPVEPAPAVATPNLEHADEPRPSEPKAAEPVAEPKAAEPVAQPKAAEPVAQPKVLEPAEETTPTKVAPLEPPSESEKPEKPAKIEPTPAEVEPAAPRDDWRDGLTRLREFSRQKAGEPGDAAQAWAIRSRVLDWLAGEGPEPQGETSRVWNSVLATLSTATGPETPDASTLAYHLSEAVDALESYAPLQITALSFCRKIDGFGHYDPIEAPAVRAGQPLLVYCEMAGLHYEVRQDDYRSRIASQVEILSTNGGNVVWSEMLGTAEDVCRRRRRDYFVNYRIVVPAKLAPGSYSLRLSQTDQVSNRSVSALLPFVVKP